MTDDTKNDGGSISAKVPENGNPYDELPLAENAAAAVKLPPEVDDGSMSIIAHLTELRSRIIKCLLAVAIGSAVCWAYAPDIMHYLTLPAGKLYYLQPAEAFFTYLKVAVAAGFLLALPVIFYHVWKFFLPALTATERMVLGIIVPASVVLFFVGLGFSFFLVLPAVILPRLCQGKQLIENLEHRSSIAGITGFSAQ